MNIAFSEMSLPTTIWIRNYIWAETKNVILDRYESARGILSMSSGGPQEIHPISQRLTKRTYDKRKPK
jgi:hypothetical protein